MAVLETLSNAAGRYTGPKLVAEFKKIVRNFATLSPGIVNSGAASVTLSGTHIGKTLNRTSAEAQAVVLPKDSDATDIPIGARGEIIATGAGALTISAGSGATMNKRASTTGVVLAHGRVVWVKTAANTYNVSGDLTASG
jgi:hypothetical protein